MKSSRFARVLITALATATAAASGPLCAQSIAVNAGTTQRVTVLPGSTFTVPVIVDLTNAGSANIASLSSGIGWGAGKLTFQSATVAPGLGWAFSSDATNAASGSVTFSASNGSSLPSTSTVANVTFVASATPGGTRVLLSPISAANASSQSIFSLLQPRGLDVCVALNGKWGDANVDATVNIIDGQQVARYSVGLSVANLNALTQLSDVNADGAVNILDAQQIARFSVGLSTASPRINTDPYVQPTVASASITANGQNVLIGGSMQLSATPYDNANADLTGCSSFTWSSSNTSIATVSPGGTVTGIAVGTATITATSTTAPGVTATIPITVGSSIVRVAISHTGRPSRLYAASVTGATISGYAGFMLLGSSMNSGSLDVYVPSAGDYTVRIIAFDAASPFSLPLVLAGGSFTITVPPSTPIMNKSLVITPPVFTANVPAQVAAGAAIPVTWSISDPSGLLDDRSLATVCGALHSSTTAPNSDFFGTQTNDCAPAHPSPGTLNFSLSLAGQSSAATMRMQMWTGQLARIGPQDWFLIYLNPSLMRGDALLTTQIGTTAGSTVTVTPASPNVAIGATQPMTATLRDANNNIVTGTTTTWQSATPSVATVSASGIVTGVAGGTSVVTATVDGVPGSTTVTVPPNSVVTSISVALGASTVSGNATTTATPTVRDQNNAVMNGVSVTWTSSNPMIARVAADGSVQALGTGTTQITARTGNVTGSTTLTVNTIAQSYDITLRYLTALQPSDQAYFDAAVTRWRRVIRGDVPSATLTNVDVSGCLGQTTGTTVLNETIDDVVIYVSVAPIDGAGGLLAQAAPCYVRPTGLTIVGVVVIDAADFANMTSANVATAYPVILHEMAHVFGIGTMWSLEGLLANAAPSAPDPAGDPTYVGINGQWAFSNLGTGYAGAVVPVENCCAPATRNKHWRESVLQRELMTGTVTVGAGAVNALSPTTAASLMDLGYVVDVSESDASPWYLRAGPPVAEVRVPIREDLSRVPVVIDASGRPAPSLAPQKQLQQKKD